MNESFPDMNPMEVLLNISVSTKKNNKLQLN